MTRWFATFILFLSCTLAESVTLEFAFQFGERKKPRLDKLLPDVARRMTFNKDGTQLIVKQMDGAVVMWDVQTRQNRIVCTVPEKRGFAYSTGAHRVLARDADDNITILSIENRDEVPLTNGQYESGSLSADGTRAVISRGDSEVEVWQLGVQDPKILKGNVPVRKLKTLQTDLPVRNGLTLSDNGQLIAAAEGSYREGEGHRTVIEVWDPTDESPTRVFNTGEILGVWNVLFSPDAKLLAVDTQKNYQSGIRVWDIKTGRKLLAKSGFEAYWTRALAFSPCGEYLVSGDEAANLRVLEHRRRRIGNLGNLSDPAFKRWHFSPNGDYVAVGLWDATIQSITLE